MKYTYLIILLFGIYLSNAQEFYFCSGPNYIYRMDDEFNVEYISNVPVIDGVIVDIAFSPDAIMYGITDERRVIRIDLVSNSYQVIYDFGVDYSFTGLYCTSDYKLLTINNYPPKLITFDLQTNSVVSEIDLENSTPGDITFYKGNMVFQGQTTTLNIISFDGNQEKEIVCSDIGFYGLSNFITDCDMNIIYAFDGNFGDIYEINIQNNSIDQVVSLNQSFLGATTINEYLASVCPFEELIEVDCTASVSEELLSNLILYPNPVNNFLHIQNLNFSEEFFFTIYSIQGKVLMEDILRDEIDASQFSSGIYLIKIYNKSKSIALTKKIVKH